MLQYNEQSKHFRKRFSQNRPSVNALCKNVLFLVNTNMCKPNISPMYMITSDAAFIGSIVM